MSPLPKGVIFDCDGVLLDSWDATMGFYNHVRSRLGLAELSAREEIVAFTLPIAQGLRSLTPKPLWRMAIAAAGELAEEDIRARIKPMAGAKACLELLLRRGLFRAANTNGGAETLRTLAGLNLLGLLDLVVTAEDVARPKPDPQGIGVILERLGLEPGEVAYLGDTEVDAATARAGGVDFWAFGRGGLGETLHVPDFATLMRYINKWADATAVDPRTGGGPCPL